MSKVYVLFVKNFPKGPGETYTYLPTYEIHYEPVKGKVAELDVGECVDTYKCTLSGAVSYGSGSYEDAENDPYVTCELYRVSNIDGVAQEELTETFILAREGR
jgi:hypothetical protein